MFRTLGLSTALLISFFGLAQQGTIIGTVTALENGKVEPQPFANVVIKGTTTGASTDLDGRYLFKVEPGTYVVVTSMVGYEAVEKSVSVVAAQTVTVDLQLNGGAMEMQAVEIVKEKRTDTETAVVMETRHSEQVVNGLGRQQIAKGQDRNAGDVVKRIPGVTLVNDRFVMIRGLADRYNTVMLNDVIAPSMEPDKRAFTFDLIPSAALDRVLIYKTGAPELPGEFAGGVIKISTLSVPQENETRITYSSSSRAGTTGGNFLSGDGGSTDRLGFDDGSRQLPSDFPATLSGTTAAGSAALGRALPNSWHLHSSTAGPDQRVGIMLARRLGKKGVKFGNVTTMDYSLTSQAYTANNYNYNAYDGTAGRSDTIYRYNDQENVRTARVSLLHNWTAMLGNHGKLEFHNLFNQIGEERTTLRTGADMEGGFDVRNYAFRWQQRTIYGGQLHGDHDLGHDRTTNLQWTAGYGLAISKEPDFRRARTQRPLENANDSEMPFMIQIAPTASVIDAGRYFSELNETVKTGKVDVEHTLAFKDTSITGKLRGGVFVEIKDRDFSARWMSFVKGNFTQFDYSLLNQPLEVAFSEENINSTHGFKLAEGTNPSDAYTAANTLVAGYFGGTFTFHRLLTLTGGARVEQNRQELSSKTYTSATVDVDNTVLSVLPSINASYNLTQRSLVRIAASQAVNRPEFRELAPFIFYDFSTNTTLTGNPDLKTASILNADARFEFYPSTSEVVSIGAFYKRFTDPIEMFFVAVTGSGGARNFSYGNARSATSLGAEIEVRKSLASFTKCRLLQHIGVVLNGSVIQSKVQLGEDVIQKSERPMVGQSPYVANAGIYFENKDTRTQINALWNVFGRRLYAAGSITTPDIYEMPRNSFDITASQGLGKHFDIKLGVQDILNQRVLLKQDSNNNGKVENKDEEMLSFRRGQYFSAGVSYRF